MKAIRSNQVFVTGMFFWVTLFFLLSISACKPGVPGQENSIMAMFINLGKVLGLNRSNDQFKFQSSEFFFD